MPIVEVHLIEGYSESEKTRICEALTDAVRIVVQASPDAVTVMVHEMLQSEYMRGRSHRSPAPALPDPREIVSQFLTLMEQRDIAAAEEYLDEKFSMTFPGTQPMHRLEDLVNWASKRYRYVVKKYDGFEAFQSPGDEAVVYCRGTLSGEWLDGEPFEGIRFIDRFEVIRGVISKQDVWNDIGEEKIKK